MSDSTIVLPRLPEGCYLSVTLDAGADYMVEVYRRADSPYDADHLVAYEAVQNKFSTTTALQDAIDALAIKINRGVALLATIKEQE